MDSIDSYSKDMANFLGGALNAHVKTVKKLWIENENLKDRVLNLKFLAKEETLKKLVNENKQLQAEINSYADFKKENEELKLKVKKLEKLVKYLRNEIEKEYE